MFTVILWEEEEAAHSSTNIITEHKNIRRPCYVSEKAYNCPIREI